jgi:hypothetical protein
MRQQAGIALRRGSRRQSPCKLIALFRREAGS